MDDERNNDDRRTVLYVEDQPINAMIMSALFERRPDLQLVVAETGEKALHLAHALQPALLLLDLQLPDCHGSELLPRLRQLPGYAGVQAVAVTADIDFDIHSSGFGEMWPKPMDLKQVLDRLDALLRAHRPPV